MRHLTRVLLYIIHCYFQQAYRVIIVSYISQAKAHGILLVSIYLSYWVLEVL